MKIRNDLFARYLGVEDCFWEIEKGIYRLQTIKKPDLPTGFKNYDNLELKDKMFIDIQKKDIESAYKTSTYCKYKNGIYYLENIWNDLVILSPELETKKQLGFHIYDDKRIELPYDRFITEVEDIWEERTPIEGFKFDVESIFYLKKKIMKICKK
jgi:hypothetical protein